MGKRWKICLGFDNENDLLDFPKKISFWNRWNRILNDYDVSTFELLHLWRVTNLIDGRRFGMI